MSEAIDFLADPDVKNLRLGLGLSDQQLEEARQALMEARRLRVAAHGTQSIRQVEAFPWRRPGLFVAAASLVLTALLHSWLR